jgi:hypothetical protein
LPTGTIADTIGGWTVVPRAASRRGRYWRAGSADELRDAVAGVKDLAAPLLIEAPITGHGG